MNELLENRAFKLNITEDGMSDRCKVKSSPIRYRKII